MKTILPKELNEKLKSEEVFILDVRAEEKFAKEHIANSINIPKTYLFDVQEQNTESIAKLPKDTEIIVTCTTGNSAKKCADILSEKGYRVTVLEGGLTAWKELRDKQK